MKGFIVSILALVFYGLAAVVGGHLLRPKRLAHLFSSAAVLGTLAYVVLYCATPRDLYDLPQAWMCSRPWVDFVYGLVIFLIMAHGFMHCVFGTTGGFSVSLLVIILTNCEKPTTTKMLVSNFVLPDQTDRIYSWRVPHLLHRGYICADASGERFVLTGKGRFIARIAYGLKRLMNLGEGG